MNYILFTSPNEQYNRYYKMYMVYLFDYSLENYFDDAVLISNM